MNIAKKITHFEIRYPRQREAFRELLKYIQRPDAGASHITGFAQPPNYIDLRWVDQTDALQLNLLDDIIKEVRSSLEIVRDCFDLFLQLQPDAYCYTFNDDIRLSEKLRILRDMEQGKLTSITFNPVNHFLTISQLKDYGPLMMSVGGRAYFDSNNHDAIMYCRLRFTD